MLIDTHAHLFWDSYIEDLDQVIKNAEEAGVTIILNVGVDITTSKKCSEFESNNPNVNFFSSIAIHPEEAIKYINNEDQIKKDIEELEKIYQRNPKKVIAVGECGLDYSYANWEGYLTKEITKDQMKTLQRKLFQAQVDLAKKLNLPLLLHVRDDRSENPELIECWDEVFKMAGDHFGILHCYSGLEQTTKRALNSNFLVSFAGNLTYKKNLYLQEAVKILPLEKIVLETDCPFLPPQSIRGKRNEPSSVKEIAELIAELKKVSVEEIAQQTTCNAIKILSLPNKEN
jgi:TatD DNase family protein